MLGNERRLLVVGIAAACAVDSGTEVPPPTTTAHTVTFASLAGVDGTITTLAFYGPNSPHPGTNAIDVGAPGGTPVIHQLDYLGADVAGGWVWVEDVHEAGRCSQWWPGSPYYNGSKIYVHVYAYDAWGNFVGSHRSAFQHVSPYWDNMNSWWTWNNANADTPAWPAWNGGAHLTYGNTVDGGLYLGGVYGVAGSIYNGPGGGLCTTGSHLHQEGDGWRAGQRWVGEHVSARYSDMHYFNLSSALSAGWPPFVPDPQQQPPPPDDPPPDDPPYDPKVGRPIVTDDHASLSPRAR